MGKTLFCDIDGTLVYQAENFWQTVRELHPLVALPGVVEKLQAAIAAGVIEKIILTTARPGLFRHFTERELARLGIPYDLLVMDAGNGPRVLVNNLSKDSDTPMASAINVKLNAGFGGVTF